MFKQILYNKHTPFWLLAFSVLIGLTVPTLIRDGMFMDAMLYTSVSHNLSKGIGTFWFPQFSVHNIAGLPSFHEQPPLVFGIQSLFFKVLGDSMYVERFYTFLTMCLTAMLMVVLWKQIFQKHQAGYNSGWLPLIFWISVPVCYWSYSNNMHENTMGIFTLCAILLVYKSFSTEKPLLIYLLPAGFFIFLASLSKGLPGFFPLAAPFLYWLLTGRISFRKSLYQTLFISVVPIVIYVILFFIPESRESLSLYFFRRALHRIHEVPTVEHRWYILWRLFTELIPQLILMGIFLLVAKLKRIKLNLSGRWREIIFFMALGISASFPLLLTLVQKGFYFVPALPFFAIGLSMIIAPVISELTGRILIHSRLQKALLVSASMLLITAIALSVMQYGKVRRNRELLHDVYLIGTVVPGGSTLSIPAKMWNDWDLQCNLVRYFNISLETGCNNDYCIIDRKIKPDSIPGYQKVDIETLQYDLYLRPTCHIQ
jgi:4-amino-4-deoxy-L-arabinose transferase-like glycosyltransferase